MDLLLLHRELLTDLNLTADLLPENLKVKVTSLESMIDQYNAAPTEEAAQSINQQSAKLWHSIKDFSEAELPDEVPVQPVVEHPAPVEEKEEPNFFQRILGG